MLTIPTHAACRPPAIGPEMNDGYRNSWPGGLPREITVPETSLYDNLVLAASRFPDKAAVVFFETPVSFARVKREVDALAAYLERCGVSQGDRVILLCQNCPQFVISYYAVLRAGGVVVPINVMSSASEIRHYLEDSQAQVVIAAREFGDRVTSADVARLIEINYVDYLEAVTTWPLPACVSQQQEPLAGGNVTRWREAIEGPPLPSCAPPGSGEICVLSYTSGTTGKPKGCIHTHRSLLAAVWSAALWRQLSAESVFLGVPPMFHMLGMQNGMNLPILLGATVVVVPRWDRVVAAEAIQRYKVSAWSAPTASLVDFFDNPEIDSYELGSLALVTGGGGPVPAAVAHELKRRFDISVNEGYGMTESAAFILCNPLHRSKPQCLGIPTFGVEARVIDPETLRELPLGEVGEIVLHGPQITQGYWNNPQGTADAFIEIDGQNFLRTGDLGRVGEDGYFFMVDRLKRMINVSGFKVWPAEVENRMYEHPAVLEACVVGVPDERQGESVKAFVILRPEMRGQVTEADVIVWARERMASYKVPRVVVFVETLPRTSSGKVLWRELS